MRSPSHCHTLLVFVRLIKMMVLDVHSMHLARCQMYGVCFNWKYVIMYCCTRSSGIQANDMNGSNQVDPLFNLNRLASTHSHLQKLKE